MYKLGRGVEQDHEKAFYWLRKAAIKGSLPEQKARKFCNYARSFEKGKGVKQDDEKAVRYYRKAAQLGNSTAQEKLKELGIDWKTL